MRALICYPFWPAARPVMYSAHSNQFIKNQELSFSQFCCPNGQRIKICVLCYSCGQQLGLQYCHWPRLAPGVGQIFSLRTFSAPGRIEMSSVSIKSSHRKDGWYKPDDEHTWNADLLPKQWSALMGWGCDDLFERHLLSAALRSLRIDPVGAEEVKQGTCPKNYS